MCHSLEISQITAPQSTSNTVPITGTLIQALHNTE